MNEQVKLHYAGSNSLLVVNPQGKLRRLFVPFAVKCIRKINIIRQGSRVYVEEVAAHNQYKIIYLILGNWYPHQNFML